MIAIDEEDASIDCKERQIYANCERADVIKACRMPKIWSEDER
jgi:hypothetical protein